MFHASIESTTDYRFESYLEQGRYDKSFEEISTLGQGGFGKVFEVRHKLDQYTYALKKIRIHLSVDEDIKTHLVYREIQAMPRLNHKNIVRYFSCWVEAVEPSKVALDSSLSQLRERRHPQRRQTPSFMEIT